MTAPTRPILGLCMSVLAGVCDYANARDGAGFSASDAATGHKLADKPEDRWTIGERRDAHRLAIKYRRQLAAAGIDTDNLPDVPAEAPANAMPAKYPGQCARCGDRINRGDLFVWGSGRAEREHAIFCGERQSGSDQSVSAAPRAEIGPIGVPWLDEPPTVACRLCRRVTDGGDLCLDCSLDVAALPGSAPVTARIRPSLRAWYANGGESSGTPMPLPKPRTSLSGRQLLGNGGPVAAKLPGYREREPQLQLVDLVEAAIRDGEHAAAEAGTGTGKSLGYMVPGLASGHQAIVSTADKALQQQLTDKDVPFLQSTLPFSFKAALLKGRGNYVCRQRIAEIEGGAQGRLGEDFAFRSVEAAQAWPQFRAWVDETDSGDLETAPFRVPGDLAADVTVGNDECTGKKCPLYGSCFAEGAKARARDADLIIVNHALLLRDADVRAQTGDMASILPNATVLLLDEAHHLADIARDSFAVEVTAARWQRIARRVERLTAAPKDADQNRKASAERWAGRLAMIGGQLLPALDAIKDRLIAARENALRLGDESTTLGPLVRSLNAFVADMEDGAPTYLATENDVEAWRKLTKAADRLAGDVATLASPTGDREWVQYAELDGVGERQRVKLICKPIDVADLLRERIFDRFDSVVACSATIATHDRGRPSFDFWKRETGCPSPRELVVGSPFDYGRQSLLYLPADGAAFDPRSFRTEGADAYHARVADQVERLISSSKGGAFVLFTSYKMLTEVHGRLKDRLSQRYLVMRQGDAVRPALVRAFKDDGNAVLFGTKSFWEGVDVQGDALRLVVIVGLPFAPPNDPMWSARCDAIDRRGGKWFFDLALPTAIIALKQGFGRLIRSVDDRGVVALIDGRLTTARYGEGIVRSLPPATRTRSVDAVSAFFGG